MIEDYTHQWEGIPVVPFNPEKTLDCPNRIYRIAYSWNHEERGGFEKQFATYLSDPKCEETVGLSLGLNDETADTFYDDVVKSVISNRVKFPKLRWLFAGEMLSEDSEITWIEQGDVGLPLLGSFPNLEELHVRGCGESFSKVKHEKLKVLVIQTAGLDKDTFEGVVSSDFPELEVLELWLGCEERDADVTVDDLRKLFNNNPFPKLKVLRLMNSELVNEIAKEVAIAPILDQLEELSLAFGVLQDHGAKFLLESERVKKLRKLDLNHHYMSEEMMSKLEVLGPEVDVSGKEEADRYDDEVCYYVAVSE